MCYSMPNASMLCVKQPFHFLVHCVQVYHIFVSFWPFFNICILLNLHQFLTILFGYKPLLRYNFCALNYITILIFILILKFFFKQILHQKLNKMLKFPRFKQVLIQQYPFVRIEKLLLRYPAI